MFLCVKLTKVTQFHGVLYKKYCKKKVKDEVDEYVYLLNNKS